MNLGTQGGNIDAQITLDLSTCLNPYGPAPAAVHAAHNMATDALFRHPYEATREAEWTFSKYLSVREEQLVSVRATSEAIWQLAQLSGDKRVILPLPTYTEYRKWFPDALTLDAKTGWHTTEQLDDAAKQADIVLFSNPQNPTGRYLTAKEIVSVARANPSCVLVVDDSYGDFLDDPAAQIVGVDVDNVIVMKAPTKFFGIGGVRVGVVWSQSQPWLDAFRNLRQNWPLSTIDVRITEAALSDVSWKADVRKWLTDDGMWLENWLRKQPNLIVVDGPLHFRLAVGDVQQLHDRLRDNRIATRILTPAHGFPNNALRITAPKAELRRLLP